jgi:hypothetical protein
MRDIGKLNENSLNEAKECIANTIDAALEACFNEKEWADTRKEIFNSWTLICAYMGDGDDGFGEFIHYYNKNRED